MSQLSTHQLSQTKTRGY